MNDYIIILPYNHIYNKVFSSLTEISFPILFQIIKQHLDTKSYSSIPSSSRNSSIFLSNDEERTNLPTPDEINIEWFDRMYSTKAKYFATLMKRVDVVDSLLKGNNC